MPFGLQVPLLPPAIHLCSSLHRNTSLYLDSSAVPLPTALLRLPLSLPPHMLSSKVSRTACRPELAMPHGLDTSPGASPPQGFERDPHCGRVSQHLCPPQHDRDSMCTTARPASNSCEGPNPLTRSRGNLEAARHIQDCGRAVIGSEHDTTMSACRQERVAGGLRGTRYTYHRFRKERWTGVTSRWWTVLRLHLRGPLHPDPRNPQRTSLLG
ncbi:hypothetical protein BV22DRAFT_902068 [Leucogyrophana mollusca]|uniref:Uncharacterized protein n=1 Tax=Leucogyrophana mollusca TaxID=85980 RepID=A0ACB8AZR6_9AGAM|nr:hypothetical protein BV22DRAFT_902068 [Leucogyrophana mollusca]